MKKMLSVLCVAASIITVSNQASATTFTPNFSDYAFPGTQFTVDAAANAYYYTNYGITIDNAYLYKDSRDTFDGIGISTGTVPEIGSPQTAKITFADTTNFVTLDWWTILPTTYSAFKSDGTLLSSFSEGSGQTGTTTFSGGIISYITFSALGGFGQVSGLTYNYDGVTDGRNTDLPGSPSAVPLPAAFPLMASALGMMGFGLRRRGVTAA